MPLDGVKLKLSSHNGIADHTGDFITLERSVSLSLKVAGTMVDGTTGH